MEFIKFFFTSKTAPAISLSFSTTRIGQSEHWVSADFIPRAGAGWWCTSSQYWWGRSYSAERVPRGMTTTGPAPGLTSVMTPAATAARMMWWRQ